MTRRPHGLALLGAAHPGPALAVTALVAAFAVSLGQPTGRILLVTAAVLAGQLSIGWSNDLIDLRRDRAVGRTDKPLATGELPLRQARVACGVAVVGTIVLSLASGAVAGAVHLGCVAAGWAYNAGLKATTWSWAPYAIAFGGLPVFAALSQPGAGPPPLWVAAAGALLGVGAHLLNALPDLEDDERTGVRGLPHRLGPRGAPVLAVTALAAATVVIALGAPSAPGVVVSGSLVLVAALATLALVGRGRVPFRAAIGIALVDVLVLVVAA